MFVTRFCQWQCCWPMATECFFQGQNAVLITAGGGRRAVRRVSVACGMCWCASTTAESSCWLMSPPAWAHRMSPKDKQFQPSVRRTEPGNAPLTQENDHDNMNDSENGSVAVGTTITSQSTPTHDDPCECCEECHCIGAAARIVDEQQILCTNGHCTPESSSRHNLSPRRSLENGFRPVGRERHDFRSEHQLDLRAGWRDGCRV